MCGIAGVFVTSGLEPRAEVVRMRDLLRHRGPDDTGIWSRPGVALANTRLSILDVSSAGHQPMSSSDGSLCVVQNGEIYNFRELRSVLEASGCVFRSDSDTEVLLHGYAQWGTGLLGRLRGMFAIALWSEREQRLLLARDRFGIKPLYIRFEHNAGEVRLVFASEIKPILSVQSGSAKGNVGLVYDFLRYGVLDHTDETFFEGIEKLPPAHYLLMDARGRMQRVRYWDFDVSSELGGVDADQDRRAAEAFGETLLESIRYHLVSDVQVGTCLSGGLDSTALACGVEAHRHASGLRGGAVDRQWTFTVGYEDPRFDERSRAEVVASAIGSLPHFTFPTADGFLADVEQFVRCQEEPCGGLGVYAHWCLMRDIHSRGLKVVLSGQGADEQLLGYSKFYLFYLQVLARQRRYGRLLTEAAAVGISPLVWRAFDPRLGLRYMGRLAALSGEHLLVGQELRQRYESRRPAIGAAASAGERIKADIVRFSLPVLLRYEDKNAMAFSVETRVPFVDHRLVEHVAGLPLNQKLRNGWTKYVMRRALRGVIPEAVRLQRRKMGFDTPESVWYGRELAKEFRETFGRARYLGDWADLPRVRERFEACQRRSQLLSPLVFFRYYIVEKWAQQFLENSPV